MWTLHVDVVDRGAKRFDEQTYTLRSKEGCETKYDEIRKGLSLGQYVAQAYAIGPNNEKIVFKEFPEDIYSVWEDLA